jgi:hypothetical protein
VVQPIVHVAVATYHVVRDVYHAAGRVVRNVYHHLVRFAKKVYHTAVHVVRTSSGGGPGGCAGHCAEGNALMALGGDPAKVMFTEAFTVNRGAGGNLQAVPKPVCAACQSDFPDRSAFAPGVTGAQGGAWGDGG